MIFLTYSGLTRTITELVYFFAWILDRKGNTEDERNELDKRIELDLAQILPRFWGLSYLMVIL